jgi:putative SOS response-associated peptidase YedK
MANDSLFAFAGLWDRWLDQENNPIETCTILTTKPNSLVADVHDRMPVMLRPEDYDLWLDPGITDSNHVVDCLKPFDATLMKKHPVSTRVNRPENDDQKCAKEIAVAGPSPRLFRLVYTHTPQTSPSSE